MRRLALPFLLTLALAVPLAACGSGADTDGAATDSTTASTEFTGTTIGDAGGVLDAVTVAGEPGAAPTLEFDKPFTATETVRKVLDGGEGTPSGPTSTVVFNYVMVNATDGNEFDSSYDRQPQGVVLDDPRLIPGFAKGLLGVRAGSRLLLAVPPADGFGDTGVPEAGVAGGDTVLAVLDVTEIQVTEVRDPLERAEGTPVEPVEGQPRVVLDGAGQPTITVPDGPAPTELVVQPLIEGDGPVVEAGQTLTVHYTGVIWSGGTEFDSSWGGTPAEFEIGVGRVIPGWDEGLVGQTVGSQILLVIPPAQGYGAEGQPAAGISGTDTLVFVVDILDAY